MESQHTKNPPAKVLFASDLDNTLIYSRRRLPPGDVICVEHYEGREQSFMTMTTVNMLREVASRAVFVPVTTRSLAQYRRIVWPEGLTPSAALVANGALLIQDGELDRVWQEETRQIIAPYRSALNDLHAALSVRFPSLTCRLVDDSYVFLAAPDETETQNIATELDYHAPLTFARSGRKLYFFPPQLDKGTALVRLQRRILPALTFAAGDSSIDAPMLRAADWALMPQGASGFLC